MINSVCTKIFFQLEPKVDCCISDGNNLQALFTSKTKKCDK